MIVLEEPYISEPLLDFLEESQVPVLRNNFSTLVFPQHNKLNILNEKEFINQYHSSSGQSLYTVSEYALDWVYQTLQDEKLIMQISLLKDKAAFRKACNSMYSDLFLKEIPYANLFTFDLSKVRLPVILKPSIGFLSTGVYTIANRSDWEKALTDIQGNFLKLSGTFPDTVVGNTQFILESYIHGQEFAIDLYFLEKEPVIINIFEHPFTSSKDVSDRLYTTNKTLFDDYLCLFTEHIARLNQLLNLSNIPVHMELRVENGKIIPIEINPLRFAGLCLNELHTHITGKHPLSYYFSRVRPDYDSYWKGKENKTFFFTVIEKPEETRNMRLDMEKIQQEFSNILEIRKVENPKLPIYAFIFSEMDNSNQAEINHILHLDINDYLQKNEKEI
jgi:Carbamoylphosphate synthase large subunit (split gene in MJ)